SLCLCAVKRTKAMACRLWKIRWAGTERRPAGKNMKKRLQNWGCRTMAEGKSLRIAYGEELCELGKENSKVVVLDADLAGATMTKLFKAQYPERFFDFGIAEANMVCAAAGMAHEGLVPFVSTFALFGAGRAYEQIRNSVAYVNANVKFC